MSDEKEGETRQFAVRAEKSEKRRRELGVTRSQRKKREKGREESRRNSRAESCPRVDVNSDINAARQQETREKSRPGWHIIRHTSLETDFDRKGWFCQSYARDRFAFDEGILFARTISHGRNSVKRQTATVMRWCTN